MADEVEYCITAEYQVTYRKTFHGLTGDLEDVTDEIRVQAQEDLQLPDDMGEWGLVDGKVVFSAISN